MPFTCPQCLNESALEITASIELPPDNRSDEITLQVVSCSQCDFRGLAVYEESRRGTLNTESWEHTGYRVELEDIQDIQRAIQDCPDPFNSKCRCQVHCRFSKTGVDGRWEGLVGVRLIDSFFLRLV